jgi:hypothetical protein
MSAPTDGTANAEDDEDRIELLRSIRAPELERTISGFSHGSQGTPASRKAAALKVAMGDSSREDALLQDAGHKFWNTQPVPGFAVVDHDEGTHGPVESARPLSEVMQEPYTLPAGFEWCSIDVLDDAQMKETYDLLSKNYVEDDDAMFRFAYPTAFLKWGLTPPDYISDWHVGVRVTKTRKLVACITGVPAALDLYGRAVRVCEINYLCVDKRLRAKRLAPVLIKEITRRVNLCGIWQAAYTAGVVLPRPVASCRYYHRSIDPKKLIEIGFSRLDPRSTMQLTVRKAKLPMTPISAGIRPMVPHDVPSAAIALNRYLARSAMRPIFTAEDTAHWLLPRAGVLDCAVVTRKVPRKRAREDLKMAVADIETRRLAWLTEHPTRVTTDGVESATNSSSSSSSSPSSSGAAASGGGGEAASLQIIDWQALIALAIGEGDDEEEVELVTDLVSFYHLPSTVIRHAKHENLYAAYLYYYVADAVPLKQLLLDALIIARDKGIDVFNCLDLQDNSTIFKDLQYVPGDGCLQYCTFYCLLYTSVVSLH